jgi:hypothetical protein
MDMESYVAVTGVWLRSVLDAQHAPLPKITQATDHVADVWFAPEIIALGAHIPPIAMAKFRKFSGPHLLRRRIDEQRTATAWIGERAIWGGESTNLTKGAGAGTQYHPATVQWRTPSGSIGWIQLTHSPKLDATADKQGITIDTSGDVSFRVYAEGTNASQLSGKLWSLPGLHVDVTTDAMFSSEPENDLQSPTAFDVTYHAAKRIRLQIQVQP